MRNDDLLEALEMIVDAHDMQTVLEHLERVADLKAEHLLTNWQDPDAAQAWEATARCIEKAAACAFDNGT